MFNSRLCIRVALLLWSVASSWAIMVTNPSEGAVWSSTGQHTVSWIEVDTDPKTFAITLVQLGVFKQILVPNVDGTTGSVTFSATLPVGDGYQVNIVKSAQEPNTILAQSPQITITSSGSGSSASSSSLTTSTSTSPSPSSSSNGTPSSTSGFSITSSASSPVSSGTRNGNSVSSSSGSAAPSPSITDTATTPNSSSSGNSGATSSLVSLEPTSSKAMFRAVNNPLIYVILFLSSIWIVV